MPGRALLCRALLLYVAKQRTLLSSIDYRIYVPRSSGDVQAASRKISGNVDGHWTTLTMSISSSTVYLALYGSGSTQEGVPIPTTVCFFIFVLSRGK